MTAPLLVEGDVYDVGVRRIVNRPEIVTVLMRRRYIGIADGRFMFEPEVLHIGAGQPDRFAPAEIASLEVAA